MPEADAGAEPGRVGGNGSQTVTSLLQRAQWAGSSWRRFRRSLRGVPVGAGCGLASGLRRWLRWPRRLSWSCWLRETTNWPLRGLHQRQPSRPRLLVRLLRLLP